MIRVFAQMPGPWSVEVAADGATALRKLAAAGSDVDLVLVDIGLPDMSGLEVISAARARSADLPILVTTVLATEETFLTAIRAGARGYLIKGDSEISLATSIDQVMRGQYPFSPALARHFFKLAGAPSTAPEPNTMNLSPREVELLRHIAKGHSYASCADVMNISLSTVQTHIRNMYRKLEVSNQRQAIGKAHASRLLEF